MHKCVIFTNNYDNLIFKSKANRECPVNMECPACKLIINWPLRKPKRNMLIQWDFLKRKIFLKNVEIRNLEIFLKILLSSKNSRLRFF